MLNMRSFKITYEKYLIDKDLWLAIYINNNNEN